VTSAIPSIEYAIVGGSATVDCRLPEDTQVAGVEVLESDLRFETPFGRTQAFKLLRLAGAECDDGRDHLALAIRDGAVSVATIMMRAGQAECNCARYRNPLPLNWDEP
jgi:hypothetical protein